MPARGSTRRSISRTVASQPSCRGATAHRSLGAAAELGAELRLSERLLLQADLRWADLDEQAALLRSEDGLVGADAVSLGVSIGWHFR